MQQSFIRQVKDAVAIEDIVGEYVQLRPAGKYLKAPCPFHQEKTPSFVVSPDKGIWHCFGACHEGGDVFTFLMKQENLSFQEAVKHLAHKIGIPLEQDTHEDPQDHMRKKIRELMQIAQRYFAYILWHTPQGLEGRTYLEQRGISREIAETFGIGYSPTGWANLTQFLTKKGFATTEINASGLGIERNMRIYDRFRGRLMFPIANHRNEYVGFSGRLLHAPGEKDGGKYINTPETLIYHKRETLYGLHITRDAIIKNQHAIIVEGEFDCITPYMHGIDPIVAIKGSSFTEEQFKILQRYCNKLYLAFDTDNAGIHALKKTVTDAEKYGFELYVLQMPAGKDPDEAVRTNLAGFRDAVTHPTPVYDHMIELIRKQYPPTDAFAKKKCADEIVPFLRPIRNPIVFEHYVQRVASLLETSPDAFRTLIRQHARNTSHLSRREQQPAQPTWAQKLQQYIVSTLLNQQDKLYIQAVKERIEDADWLDIATAKLVSLLPATPPAELQEIYNTYLLAASFIADSVDLQTFIHTVEEFRLLRLRERMGESSDETEQIRLMNILSGLEKNRQK